MYDDAFAILVLMGDEFRTMRPPELLLLRVLRAEPAAASSARKYSGLVPEGVYRAGSYSVVTIAVVPPGAYRAVFGAARLYERNYSLLGIYNRNVTA